MPTWIALLRGINVLGHNRIPMKELARELEDLGCTEVRTWIQSGNAVFRSGARSPGALSGRIAEALLGSHGFRPEVVILTPSQLRKALDRNPFPQAEAEPGSVHLCFCARKPTRPDRRLLDEVRLHHESWVLDGSVLYLHTPKGYGRSKLAQSVERALGVPVTARNWRTAGKVLRMAEEVP